MNKLYMLFKVQLKSSFNLLQYLSSIKTNKKQAWKLGLVVLFIIAIGPSYFLYNGLIQLLFENLSAINQQGAVIAAGITGTSLVVLFFGIMYVFSALFGAKDLEMLLALPIKPGFIIASKLSSIIVAEYLFTVPLAAPIFINYGVNVGAGFLYWVYSLLIVLLIPVVPISIGAILTVLVVRLFGMRVNVEKIQMVFMIVFMIAMLSLNFFATQGASGIQQGSEQEYINQLIANNHLLIDSLAKTFPPAKFAAESVLNFSSFGGIINLLMYALISAGLFLAAVFIGDKVYLKGVNRGLGAKIKKRKAGNGVAEIGASSSKPVSIFKNDFRIMLRTPIFAFNTLLIVPLLPAIMIFSFISGGSSLDSLRLLYLQYSNEVAVFFSVAMVMVTGITTVTGTTFSREGSAFWLNQIAPVHPVDQLLGRCMSAAAVNGALIVMMAVVVGIIGGGSNILLLILMTVTALIASLPMTVIGLLIDLIHPYLNWTDPAKAVKQNINVLFMMIAAMLMAALFGGLALLLMAVGLPVYAIMGIIVLLSGSLAYGLAKFFIRLMPKAIIFK